MVGLFSKLLGTKAETYAIPTGRDVDVALFEGTGSMEVVGESHYQGALKMTWDACNHSGRDRSVDCYAILQPQPDNPYDRSAVGVWSVPGGLSGHLPRQEAARWHRLIADAWRREGKPIAVPARVMTRDGSLYGLWLDWPDDFAD